MIAGTMSSVGKSLITAGLCRLFARNGVSVAPFKAQNMNNNAAVCADGGEIGRAQAIQAQAARILPTVDMNPILMKPEADYKSQIIVQGMPIGTFNGRDYYRMRESLWGNVTESLDRLREAHELVLIEGAGSIATVVSVLALSKIIAFAPSAIAVSNSSICLLASSSLRCFSLRWAVARPPRTWATRKSGFIAQLLRFL